MASSRRMAKRSGPSFETTVCGLSSAFVQVTLVPGLTVTTGALKVKLAIWTEAGAGAGAALPISDIVRISSALPVSAAA